MQSSHAHMRQQASAPPPLFLLPLQTGCKRVPAKIQASPEVAAREPGAFSRAKVQRSLFENPRAAAVGGGGREPKLQQLMDLLRCVAVEERRVSGGYTAEIVLI